jgi:3-oxoacyl-[acyl-carrier protein] reductase
MLRIGDLADKSILITGASSGIGAALSYAFARQGARVGLHCNRNESAAESIRRDIEQQGGKAALVRGDLTRSGEPQRIVNEGAEALGGLDVLINNAGALVSRQPILDAEDVFVNAVFDLNARAVIHTSRAAVPHLKGRGGGAIINVGSIAGLDGGGSGAGIYGAAKAFVHNLTRHLAREFAAANIRVNTVSPGVVATPFHHATPPERMEAMRRSVPMGRTGTPDDCVGAFLFLASPTLSGYITGQNIHVNGGQAMP